jgi:hypothetical protein
MSRHSLNGLAAQTNPDLDAQSEESLKEMGEHIKEYRE